MKYQRLEYIALSAIIAAGVVLGAVIFTSAHNTIADEEVYLDQVLRLFSSASLGTGLRSYFYPLLLTPAKYLAVTLGFAQPLEVTAAIRLGNYLVAALGVYWCYLLTVRLFDVRTALIAVALLVGHSYWQIDAARLMVNVPASVWLVGAVAILAGGVNRRFAAFGVAVLLALSVFTKFQAAPAAFAVVLWALLDPSARGIRFPVFRQVLVGGVFMLVCFFGVEWSTYGNPFGSLSEFYQYNLANRVEYATRYGECPPPGFYLSELTKFFSYLVPVFAAIGIAKIVMDRGRSLGLLVVILVYMLALELICRKTTRFFILITPFVFVLAACGITAVLSFFKSLSWYPKEGVLASIVSTLLVIPVWLSVLPRNDIRAAFSREEACPPFVYSMIASGPLRGATKIGLAVPCGMPAFYLDQYRIVYIDQESVFGKRRALDQLQLLLARSEFNYVFLEQGSWLEASVLDAWSTQSVLVAESAHGKFRLWRRASTPQ